MPRNTTLDTILNTRHVASAYRILTCDLSWPSGDPPFASGAVSVPAIGTPPAYVAASFNAAVWTDVTGFITSYRFASSIDQQCDVLTLTVPCAWAGTDLDRVFRAMRAILVQERHTGAGSDTDWLNVAWCLSTGYAQQWDANAGAQVWTVNALDALMLANLDVIGTDTGSAVYQADLVKVGTLETHQALTLLPDDFTDAWEFGMVDGSGYLHPNWADKPAPQCWCHNVPGATDPVPLAIAGDAVQAVFGEGIVRIGKTWAKTAPGSGPDYSVGLGFPETVVNPATDIPDIRCYLSRFAHPAIADRDGNTVASDLIEAIVQAADPPVAGEVLIEGDYSDAPAGLTLILLDGTGARYKTTGHEVAAGVTTFALADTSATVATGTALRYGEANRADDLLRRWLIDSGFQVSDNTAPLYAAQPDAPELQGAAVPIIVPPLVFQESDRATRLAAMAELRRSYAVLPNWLTRATAAGQIATTNIVQLFDTAAGPNASILPLPAVMTADAEKTDLNVFTRVVARGSVRQVSDAADVSQSAVTIADVNAAGGGLPDVTGYHSVTINGTTYTVNIAERATPPDTGNYYFPLANLLTRGLAPSVSGWTLRPWAWYWLASKATGYATNRILRDAWRNAVLCEIDFPAPVTIDQLELNVANSWWSDPTDYGYGNHAADVIDMSGGFGHWTTIVRAHADAQTLEVRYFDAEANTWETLAANIGCPVAADQTALITLTTADFATRAPVQTSKLQLVCTEPFFAECSVSNGAADFYALVGVYLSQLKAWGSGELRGVAEIGTTAPFTGAFWTDVRSRMRRRTYVVPDVSDWAATQTDVNNLAVEWLYEVTRNLAPRPVTAVRPDARVGDTVRMALPTGRIASYGDGSAQLSKWILTGFTAANSDDGVLYWSLTNSGSTRTVTLYSDSARTVQVAAGSRTGNGSLTLAAVNSRIAGSVTVAYTGNDTGTVGLPTYLITAVEHAGEAGNPAPSRLTLVSYVEPYFEE